VALNALTLAVTQGVVGRPFFSAVNGITYRDRVQVLVDGSPGGSYVNGVVSFASLPYPTSTIVLREYEPGVGVGYRDSRIDITGATSSALRAQALASLSNGRTLRNWRVGSVRQPDGSYVYSLFVEDDLGATPQLSIGSGTPTPTPAPTLGTPVLSGTLTQGAAASGVNLLGLTDGSTVTFNIAGLTIGTSGTTRAITGTPATSGPLIATETLAGATNSPNPTTIGSVIAASATNTITADGYSVAGNSLLPNATYTVTRAGFDSTGAPTTYTETVNNTGPYFQVAPTLAPSTTVSVLSATIWSHDSIVGLANNSPDAAPKPIVLWQQLDRRIVKGRVKGSLVAYHFAARNGKPVALVKLLVSDGTNTITVNITDPTVDTTQPNRDADGIKVWEYNYDVDVSTLANGPITVNAEVYPWQGDATSVAKSVDGVADSKGFCTQKFLKDGTIYAENGIRNYVYHDATTGNDSTAYVGPDPALAKASPAQTEAGGWNRAVAVLTATGLDGLGMFYGAGTWEPPGGIVTRGNSYEITVQRDPAVPKANVIYGFGTAGYNGRCDYLGIRDITMKRLGTNQLKNKRWSIRDVDFDPNGFTGTPFWTNGSFSIEGNVTFLSGAGGAMLPALTSEMRMMRGLTTTGYASFEVYNIVGCRLEGGVISMVANRTAGYFDGFIVYSNKFMKLNGSNDFFGMSETVNGALLANNVFEWISGTGPSVRFSGDNRTNNLRNVHAVHNTFVGAQNSGRINWLYDENATTPRTHKYNTFHNNIVGQLNTKNGWFLYLMQSIADGRTGGLEFFHGVNVSGTFTMMVDAGPNRVDFRQYYPGRAAQMTTTTNVYTDPKFVNNQGIKWSGSATVNGTGGGDYSLAADSPCKNAGIFRVLPGGINGVAYTATPNLGAFG